MDHFQGLKILFRRTDLFVIDVLLAPTIGQGKCEHTFQPAGRNAAGDPPGGLTMLDHFDPAGRPEGPEAPEIPDCLKKVRLSLSVSAQQQVEAWVKFNRLPAKIPETVRLHPQQPHVQMRMGMMTEM
jgi:hypothetical protein